jgi:hypothetical protein
VELAESKCSFCAFAIDFMIPMTSKILDAVHTPRATSEDHRYLLVVLKGEEMMKLCRIEIAEMLVIEKRQ